MDWNLFCPKCCCVVDSFRSLKSVHNHYHCAFCATDYEAALDEYIAVAFTISPEIRTISFHDPLQLTAGDYFWHVRNTADGYYYVLLRAQRYRAQPQGTCVMRTKDLADPRWDGRLGLELGDFDWYAGLVTYWLEQGKTRQEIDDLLARMRAAQIG
jgi:hypothetical protein